MSKPPGPRYKRISDGVWTDNTGEPVWETKDGRQFYIPDMGTEHIQRCIANIMIRGNWRLGYLPLLIEELERRSKAGA